MIPLYSPQAVRAMDERAFARGVSSATLMERAAGHLARAVLAVTGHAYGCVPAFVCGKGNNGGDGIAAARRLLDAGARPRVCLVVPADELGDDAAAQLRRWRARGGRVHTEVHTALQDADVAVDCLLGTGARGEPREPYRSAVEAVTASGLPVVACDVPTGVDAATGAVPGVAIRAAVTVTLGAHKLGLWVWPARGHAGRVVLGELGIVDDGDVPDACAWSPGDVAAHLGSLPADADKRDRGVVVVLAGSAGMTGAAVLTARGALAVGAGLVTVATPPAAQPIVAASVPEALTVAVRSDDSDGAFRVLAEHLERATVLAVGPGLGLGQATVDLVRRVVAEVDLPLVLDADGLNAFRHHGDALAERVAGCCTLTPHRRELARLVGPEPGRLWEQRVERLPELARRWRSVIVAKGPASLIAAPDGRRWCNPTGSVALATGGTGDVLTGMTAALLGVDSRPESVVAAVHLHGRAGELAAARRGTRSVTAGDVAAAVPAALAELEAAW